MATAAAAPSGTASAAPNQSLYIQNLNEKLQKEDLRRALYMLFSAHGSVLDVTALKTKKMRGQAHILFKDVNSATQAMRSCQGFEFFGRKISISYSKNRSQTLAKLTGTFQAPNATAAQTKQAAQPPSGFPAPPGSFPPPPGSMPAPPGALPAPPSGLPGPPGTSQKPNGAAALEPPNAAAQDAPSPQGTKRQREESDEEDAPMDEDDDEGEMEMSDDD